MTAFNTKIAAGVAVALGVVYMVAGLATGHTSRSEPPPDLSTSATETGMDVWKAAAALLDDPAKTLVVDVRNRRDFERYHVPGALNVPGASASRLVELASQHAPILVVAAKDEAAQKLVSDARSTAKDARIHYLVDGARSWYLAFDLPVSLFAETAAPSGYEHDLETVKGFLVKQNPPGRDKAIEALQSLVKANYQPTLLKQAGKPKSAAAAKKKISGGCG